MNINEFSDKVAELCVFGLENNLKPNEVAFALVSNFCFIGAASFNGHQETRRNLNRYFNLAYEEALADKERRDQEIKVNQEKKEL